MKIGLIDADRQWRDRPSSVKNKMLMQVAAFHKSCGDEVDWYNAMDGMYDKVYVAKRLKKTQDTGELFQAKEVIKIGSAYGVSKLPTEISATTPDETIYPR